MSKELDQLEQEALAALGDVLNTDALREWESRYTGKKGAITQALKKTGSLPAEERSAYGQRANAVKETLLQALGEKAAALEHAELETALADGQIDVTLPGRPQSLGGLHLSTQTLRQIAAIWAEMGFQVYRSRDVEDDYHNFTALNIPPHHPARDMWDTFYTTTEGVLLRTHTSPGQIHAMRRFAPEPVRVILPGKVYRYEEVSARSESMFHQIEGLAVGRNITFANLKGVILSFAQQLYGPETKIRLRKSYFPFTEPSVEADVSCTLCGAKGCPVCKYSGWLEIMGAGMVHPKV
ncbi:MAG: phenylalanine--tRNA ligase subunit alpha, partial [Anaerolineales bacterium]